jgi:hypothetical protein
LPGYENRARGLGVSASEWEIAMDQVQRAKLKPKGPDSKGKELLALFLNLKDQMVERGEELPDTTR